MHSGAECGAKIDWVEENCGYSSARNPNPSDSAQKPTWQLLNSGLVVLHPDVKVFEAMLDFLYNSPMIANFMFPDQNFLAHWFVSSSVAL
jgi:hypothetical protein